MEEIDVHFVDGDDCMGQREAYWRAVGRDADGRVVMRCAQRPEDARALLNQALRPRIVCLCGSTRFANEFMAAQFTETIAGRIVLTVGCFPRRPDGSWDRMVVTDEQKVALDALHLRKIDLADEVLVLNVGGYIGESTSREIAYAEKIGRPIRYLEEIHDSPSREQP